MYTVERLYCKRPILCISSSKILTPLTARRGEDKLAGWRKGWGVNILEGARHSSVLYICKYFVMYTESITVSAPSMNLRPPHSPSRKGVCTVYPLPSRTPHCSRTITRASDCRTLNSKRGLRWFIWTIFGRRVNRDEINRHTNMQLEAEHPLISFMNHFITSHSQ
jgi:hypothetical protein